MADEINTVDLILGVSVETDNENVSLEKFITELEDLKNRLAGVTGTTTTTGDSSDDTAKKTAAEVKKDADEKQQQSKKDSKESDEKTAQNIKSTEGILISYMGKIMKNVERAWIPDRNISQMETSLRSHYDDPSNMLQGMSNVSSKGILERIIGEYSGAEWKSKVAEKLKGILHTALYNLESGNDIPARKVYNQLPKLMTKGGKFGSVAFRDLMGTTDKEFPVLYGGDGIPEEQWGEHVRVGEGGTIIDFEKQNIVRYEGNVEGRGRPNPFADTDFVNEMMSRTEKLTMGRRDMKPQDLSALLLKSFATETFKKGKSTGKNTGRWTLDQMFDPEKHSLHGTYTKAFSGVLEELFPEETAKYQKVGRRKIDIHILLSRALSENWSIDTFRENLIKALEGAGYTPDIVWVETIVRAVGRIISRRRKKIGQALEGAQSLSIEGGKYDYRKYHTEESKSLNPEMTAYLQTPGSKGHAPEDMITEALNLSMERRRELQPISSSGGVRSAADAEALGNLISNKVEGYRAKNAMYNDRKLTVLLSRIEDTKTTIERVEDRIKKLEGDGD